jgi:hypothetical protein
MQPAKCTVFALAALSLFSAPR